jgi:hypothetical protein
MMTTNKQSGNLTRISDAMSPDSLRFQQYKQLEERHANLQTYCKYLESEKQELESKVDSMKGVMFFTFFMSALACLLILEQILSPFLRTL